MKTISRKSHRDRTNINKVLIKSSERFPNWYRIPLTRKQRQALIYLYTNQQARKTFHRCWGVKCRPKLMAKRTTNQIYIRLIIYQCIYIKNCPEREITYIDVNANAEFIIRKWDRHDTVEIHTNIFDIENGPLLRDKLNQIVKKYISQIPLRISKTNPDQELVGKNIIQIWNDQRS